MKLVVWFSIIGLIAGFLIGFLMFPLLKKRTEKLIVERLNSGKRFKFAVPVGSRPYGSLAVMTLVSTLLATGVIVFMALSEMQGMDYAVMGFVVSFLIAFVPTHLGMKMAFSPKKGNCLLLERRSISLIKNGKEIVKIKFDEVDNLYIWKSFVTSETNPYTRHHLKCYRLTTKDKKFIDFAVIEPNSSNLEGLELGKPAPLALNKAPEILIKSVFGIP